MLTDQDVLYAFGIRLQVARESVGLSALHDLECVDPVLQLSGVNQAPQDVVVQVPEAQSDTTQVLEPAVDRFHRAVGCADVEVVLLQTSGGEP